MLKHEELSNLTAAHLQKLSEDVNQVMVKNGVVSEASGCRTECSITIGSDGKPVYSCKVVCDL